MGDKSKTVIIKGNNTNSTTNNNNSNNNSVPQDFGKIIRHFKKYSKFIKRLAEDTDKSYAEIKEKRVLSQGRALFFFFFFFYVIDLANLVFFFLEKFKEIQLTQTDRDFLESLTTRPLALIICSQTYEGKARFVNDLLNEPLLPLSPTVKHDDVIRMIRIKVDRFSIYSFDLHISLFNF